MVQSQPLNPCSSWAMTMGVQPSSVYAMALPRRHGYTTLEVLADSMAVALDECAQDLRTKDGPNDGQNKNGHRLVFKATPFATVD